GTLDPSEKLEVDGGGSIARIAINSNSPFANAGIRLLQDGVSRWSVATVNPDGDFQIYEDDSDVNRFVIKGGGPHWGNVGIGARDPEFSLDVAGPVRATQYLISSDARLKTELAPLTGVVEKLQRIHGMSFRWNQQAEAFGYPRDQRGIGVVAQEVESVFPEVVSAAGKDGYKAVDYSRLTAVLIEAVKELKSENDSLRKRMELLEAQELHRERGGAREEDGVEQG